MMNSREISQIVSIIENDEGGMFGFRVIPSGFEVEQGAELADSFAWDFENDVSSKTSKGGVSTIGIDPYPDADEIIACLEMVGRYSGKQLVLVRGTHRGSHDIEEGDAGELVIANAVAFRVYSI